MAIKGTFTTNSGIVLQEAYANIPRVEVFKQVVDGVKKFVAVGYVTVYATQESYAENKNIVEGLNVSFDVDPTNQRNLIEQAYSVLKESNKIINAVDC